MLVDLADWRAVASMRPRGLPRGCGAAGRRVGRPPRGFNEAAGITPRMPELQERFGRTGHHASMRPRGLPRGCYQPGIAGSAAGSPCFNEAAGITPRMPCSRGKPCWRCASFNEAAGITPRMQRDENARHRHLFASMRPRGLPRGCGCRRGAVESGSARFNEAAGITPRMHRRRSPRRTTSRRFNEAAGITPRMHCSRNLAARATDLLQ